MNAAQASIALLLVASLLACREEDPGGPVEHVVVIGVDGLSPAGIHAAETPNIDALIAAGAHSFAAEAVLPTTSAPNWASMLMGLPPEVHGILEKRWDKRAVRGRSYCGNPPGVLPPNIFRVTREQRPDADVVVFYEWAGIGDLLEPTDCTKKKPTYIPTGTAEAAEERIAETQPLLLFLQFVHVDNIGHRFGHGSERYYKAIGVVDEMIGRVLAALDAAGIRESTVVLVTSDHGGLGKSHGGDTPEERLVPWIIAGPGIARGTVISDPIVITDTAATVAALLGVEPPACWTGRPVTGAFSRGRFGARP
jgi:predicted AlkP superfamily pyrophosphatase or phosphodiesterase